MTEQAVSALGTHVAMQLECRRGACAHGKRKEGDSQQGDSRYCSALDHTCRQRRAVSLHRPVQPAHAGGRWLQPGDACPQLAASGAV